MHSISFQTGIMNYKTSKFNRWWIGWIVGIISPISGMIILYIFDRSFTNFENFIVLSYKLGIITNLLSISLLANLIGFYVFLNKEWYYAVRGVILGVITWGAVILFLRLTIPEM